MNTCPRCKNPTEQTDNYCRHCGKSMRPGQGFLFTHAGIVLMALILGPFALPCVWMSRVIGTTAKWLYTLLLAAMGVYLVLMLHQSYLMIQEAAHMMMGGGL